MTNFYITHYTKKKHKVFLEQQHENSENKMIWTYKTRGKKKLYSHVYKRKHLQSKYVTLALEEKYVSEWNPSKNV